MNELFEHYVMFELLGSTQRCSLVSKEAADRYPPITSTFLPDGNFDLEWVDTSLRMVDLWTENPRYKKKKKAGFVHDHPLMMTPVSPSQSGADAT